MYLYFNKNGVLKEIVNDEAARQGSSHNNRINVYFEGAYDDNGEILTTISSAACRFRLPDTSVYPLSAAAELSRYDSGISIPFDKRRDLKFFEYGKEYKMFYIDLPDEVLATNGSVGCSVWFVQENKIIKLGMFAFNIEASVESDIETDKYITVAEWNELMKMFGVSNTRAVASLGSLTQEQLANIYYGTDMEGGKSAVIFDLTTRNIYELYKDTDDVLKTREMNLVADAKIKFEGPYDTEEDLPTPEEATYGNAIYLVKNGDVFNEYVTLRFAMYDEEEFVGYRYVWEMIGTTAIDLSNYAKLDADNTYNGSQTIIGGVTALSLVASSIYTNAAADVSYIGTSGTPFGLAYINQVNSDKVYSSQIYTNGGTSTIGSADYPYGSVYSLKFDTGKFNFSNFDDNTWILKQGTNNVMFGTKNETYINSLYPMDSGLFLGTASRVWGNAYINTLSITGVSTFTGNAVFNGGVEVNAAAYMGGIYNGGIIAQYRNQPLRIYNSDNTAYVDLTYEKLQALLALIA